MQSPERRYSYSLDLSAANLASAMDKLSRKTWKPLGLSPSHAYILLLLVEEYGIAPSVLAKQLLLSPATITRLVQKLEKQGWVYKMTYRHAILVRATPKAYDLRIELWERHDAFYRHCKQSLGEDCVRDLVASMNEVTDKMSGFT